MPSDDDFSTLMGEDTWPVPVEARPYHASISTSDLPQLERQVLWRHLQEFHPQMAKTLKVLVDTSEEGVFLKGLMDQFQAGFVIPGHMLPASMKWRLVQGSNAKLEQP